MSSTIAHNSPVDPTKFVVYSLTHIPSGKVYIGKTRTGFVQRLCFHLHDAFNVKKPDLKFADMREDITTFSYRILEVCSSDDLAEDREMYAIATAVNSGVLLYNSNLKTATGTASKWDKPNPYIALKLSVSGNIAHKTSLEPSAVKGAVSITVPTSASPSVSRRSEKGTRVYGTRGKYRPRKILNRRLAMSAYLMKVDGFGFRELASVFRCSVGQLQKIISLKGRV